MRAEGCGCVAHGLLPDRAFHASGQHSRPCMLWRSFHIHTRTSYSQFTCQTGKLALRRIWCEWRVISMGVLGTQRMASSVAAQVGDPHRAPSAARALGATEATRLSLLQCHAAFQAA